MDDRRFDDIVKNKLESINPAYNDQAWKALDYRLDLLAPLPWYSRWKSLLVASSLGVITLLNIGLLYKVDNEQHQLKQLVELLSDRERNSAPDTVYLSTQNYLSHSFLDRGTSPLLASVDNSGVYDLFDPLSVYKITASINANSGTASTAPASPGSTVISNHSISSSTIDRPIETITSLDPFNLEYMLNSPDADDMYVRGVVLPPKKKKWDYPIQPRIGFSAGYLIPNPDLGERFVTSRQSVLVESAVGRNFHVMTGLSHQEFTYKLDDVDDNNFELATLLNYPGFGSFTSAPDEITVQNTMLQIPLYLRYYKPLNHSWSVFAGGGPTLDILLKQKFTYSFLEIQDEQLVEFDEVVESDDIQFTLGSFSANMGVAHYFNRRFSAQVELNYQYGLGKIGLEKRSFDSFTVSGGLFYKLSKTR